MAGFGLSTSIGSKKAKKKRKPAIDGSALTYLKQRHGEDSVEYQSALRGTVDAMKILSPRQSILQTEEIFEDAAGERRSVSDIAHGLGGRQIEVSDGRVPTRAGTMLHLCEVRSKGNMRLSLEAISLSMKQTHACQRRG